MGGVTNNPKVVIYSDPQIAYKCDLHRNSTIGYMSTMYDDEMSVTTEAPSPSTALSANSGTGNQEGRPTIRPSRSHSSDKRTGLGAVPLITPNKQKVRQLSIYYYNTILQTSMFTIATLQKEHSSDVYKILQ